MAKAKPEMRHPRRQVVRTEADATGTISTLACGHVVDTAGMQSGMWTRCKECPEEEFDG